MSDNFFSESDWSYDLFCDPISQFLQSKSSTGDLSVQPTISFWNIDRINVQCWQGKIKELQCIFVHFFCMLRKCVSGVKSTKMHHDLTLVNFFSLIENMKKCANL